MRLKGEQGCLRYRRRFKRKRILRKKRYQLSYRQCSIHQSKRQRSRHQPRDPTEALSSSTASYNGATLNIEGGTVTTNGSHANGVFAYETSTVNISDTTINTSANNSGGIMVTGGGNVTLKLCNQEVDGDIIVDSISALTMTMSDGISYKGAINNANGGTVSLTLSNKQVP